MITRGLPSGRQAANDRAPTIEEIKKSTRSYGFDCLSKTIKLTTDIILLSVKVEHRLKFMHRKWNI
jgi:hypothetical protein